MGFDFLDQRLDLRLAGIGHDFLVDRNNRPLDFSTPGFDPLQELGRDATTVREPLGHHVPVTSIVSGQPNPPQAIPQRTDLGLFDQAGEDPHGFDGPPNGDPKLVDVFHILVTFLGGEGKSVANGFEASVENSTCHLAHGLIRGDPDDPLTVRRDCGWFRFEKLFGHWRLSPWRRGKLPLSVTGRFLRLTRLATR